MKKNEENFRLNIAGNTRLKSSVISVNNNYKSPPIKLEKNQIINPFKNEKNHVNISHAKINSMSGVVNSQEKKAIRVINKESVKEEPKIFQKTPFQRSNSNFNKSKLSSAKINDANTNLKQVINFPIADRRDNSVEMPRCLTEVKDYNDSNQYDSQEILQTNNNDMEVYDMMTHKQKHDYLKEKICNNPSQGLIYSPRAKLVKPLIYSEKAETNYDTETNRPLIQNKIGSFNNLAQITMKSYNNYSFDQLNTGSNNFNKSNVVKAINNQIKNLHENNSQNNSNYLSNHSNNIEQYNINDNESVYSTNTTTMQSKFTNKNLANKIGDLSIFNYYVNIEDLIILEEKLITILNSLDKNQRIIANTCFDWWNFSNFCTICGKFEFYFKDYYSKSIIRETNLIELITIILCYDLSFNPKIYQLLQENLENLLNLIHQNFLIICEYLMSKVAVESLGNIWVRKMSAIINNKLICQYIDKISSLKKNNEFIKKIIKNIFELYSQGELIISLSPYLTDLKLLTMEKLNEIFRKKSLRIENKNASIPAAVFLDKEEKLNSFEGAFSVSSPTKEFSLVLDLDETLIHFQVSSTNENKGTLNLRPGLFHFLNNVSLFYELMIFTAGTSDYADPIINAIDRDNKYFTHRFYRQHTSIQNGDFVKDISRIGRDLSKTIIVDNMPQNFRLQKENGIFIKTFYGDDTEDTALFELTIILKNIAQSNNKDVRINLIKYKDEITKRVSSNISKSVQY